MANRRRRMGAREQARIDALPPRARGQLAAHTPAPLTDAEVAALEQVAATGDRAQRVALVAALRERYPDAGGLLSQLAAWLGINRTSVFRDLEAAAAADEEGQMGRLERERLAAAGPSHLRSYAPLTDAEVRALQDSCTTVENAHREQLLLIARLRRKYPHQTLVQQLAPWLGVSRATAFRMMDRAEAAAAEPGVVGL